MGKQRTDKSRFQSKYSPGKWISESQYLAETMVERMAQKDGKTLPLQFWNIPAWKKPFLYQVQMAAKLLNEFSVQQICRALKTKEGSKIYSLGATFLRDILVQMPTGDVPESYQPSGIDYSPELPVSRPPYQPAKSWKNVLGDL